MPDANRPDEFFDIVDENDLVIGRATRREVHARGWRHRAVHVLVRNRAGRWFLQKRSQKKDVAPGTWDSSASGHVDSGEDYDSSAVRELEEEIGLCVKGPLERWLRLEACEETGQEHVWFYRFGSEGPFILNPDEIEAGAWLTADEISRGVRERPEAFSPSFRLIWRQLEAQGKLGAPE